MSSPAETSNLVRRFIAALNDRSVAGAVALVDEDVAYDPPQGTRTIGSADFETALIHRFRCFEEALSDLQVLASDDGLRGSAEFTARGTYAASDQRLPPANGQLYSVAGSMFFEVEGGKITRLTEDRNITDWAAQLSKN